MLAAFDATEISASGKSRGIFNYAKSLICELNRRRGDRRIEWVVLCNGDNKADFESVAPSADFRIVFPKSPTRYERYAWHVFGARRELKGMGAAVYFSPKGFLPLRLGAIGCRTVVVVHDLIPLWYADFHPGFFPSAETKLVSWSLRRSVRWADRLIVISDFTGTDVRVRTGTQRRLDVVRNGVTKFAVGFPKGERPDFILCVTSSLPHKNFEAVLKAYLLYRRLSRDPLELYVCGVDDPETVGVVAFKGISDEELYCLYSSARVFMSLSLVEGFGLPVVEALSSGTPVICSDIAAYREIKSPYVSFESPEDPVKVAFCLASVLSMAAPSRQIVSASVSCYSWEKCLVEIEDVLLDAVPRRTDGSTTPKSRRSL